MGCIAGLIRGSMTITNVSSSWSLGWDADMGAKLLRLLLHEAEAFEAKLRLWLQLRGFKNSKLRLRLQLQLRDLEKASASASAS